MKQGWMQQHAMRNTELHEETDFHGTNGFERQGSDAAAEGNP